MLIKRDIKKWPGGSRRGWPPPEVRFWAYVRKSPRGCWGWRGKTDTNGYGRIAVEGRNVGASRYAWKLLKGRWPPSRLFVLHTCDNPPCVNPKHLFLGTQKANMRDCVAKGRHWSPGGNGLKGEACHLSKLTQRQVFAIRREYSANVGKVSMRGLAAQYGVTDGAVRAVLLGGSWRPSSGFVASKVVYKRGSAHHRSKLNEKQVLRIKRAIRAGKLMYKEIAAAVGVSPGAVSEIAAGRAWAWLTLPTP